jgi:alpha-1,3-mannosyl-glycoprotein beta-1,2-N-acetylglucosaminyltransferase
VCRNFNFGEHGSSAGQFYRQFLKPVQLANESVPWTELDLSYLQPERWVICTNQGNKWGQ